MFVYLNQQAQCLVLRRFKKYADTQNTRSFSCFTPHVE